jgi:calpain
LGIGDWGLGIGDWAQSPIPNPQSPIPNDSDLESDDEKKDFIPNIHEINKKTKSLSHTSSKGEKSEHSHKSSKTSGEKVFKKSLSNSVDNSEENDKFGVDDSHKPKLPEFTSAEEVEEFFKNLRYKFKQKEKEGNLDNDSLWEDPEFVGEISLFHRDNSMPKKYEGFDISFERPNNNSEQGDSQKLEFFNTDSSSNINYQFKVKKGMLNDKFLVGCILMLFKARSEYFSNLVLDYENVNENLKYGFCGFQFFINGEWKYVVIDTTIPWHEADNMALSSATSIRSSFWLTLVCKAYAKIFKSYDILNDVNVSIKNVLVDFTGGTSKKIEINSTMNELDKKLLFEELKKLVHQGYLVGCIKYEEIHEDDLDDTQSDAGEDEDILQNSMYVFLDVQEADGNKLIYLNNSWGKGKWTGAFSPEDENWETSKGLKEKLCYENQNDGTHWMLFEQWILHFNIVYTCRIYPSSWHQFCIPGQFMDQTSGGAPVHNDELSEENKDEKSIIKQKTNTINTKSIDKKQDDLKLEKKGSNIVEKKESAELKYREIIKRVIIKDSDDRWFLNPQYKLEIKPKTKLIISMIQEDDKLSGKSYQPYNFIILLCSGKYSRVWDIKKENVIKKAITNKDSETSREIVCQLTYQECLDILAIKKKKKVITKLENIYVNLVPYQEYTKKNEIEKSNQTIIFKQCMLEGTYWIRIFSSESLGIVELPPSYQKTIDHNFNETSWGGSRFLPNSNEERLYENPYWPINPQFLLKFNSGTKMKIILRTTSCAFRETYEENKIGMILTKPDLSEYNVVSIKSLKPTGNYKKSDAILRVIETSDKILDSKNIKYEEIDKKLFFNLSEWMVESQYKSCYNACLFQNFNKIDSPIMVIPTMNNYQDKCDFTLTGK